MNQEPISDRIVRTLDALPAQLQSAARYVLEHPHDVALLTMREQARRAGLPPATLTRFAQRLGLEGYDELRALHAAAIRQDGPGFAGRVGTQVSRQRLKGDRALADEILQAASTQVAQLASPETLEELLAVADRVITARRVYCLGLRACHPVARHIHYVLSLFLDHAVLLDPAGGVGLDPIRTAGPKDLLLVVSVSPYTRAAIETARYAAGRGVPVAAITDSKASPLVPLARHALFGATASPTFFHTMIPVFALGETLATLAAGRGGDGVKSALKRTEDQLAAFDVHWKPKADRKRPVA